MHSKVSVIDDRLLRVGSANINNRSMGYDTECDLAVEAAPGDPDAPRTAAAIVAFRDRLLAEHLGVTPDELAAAISNGGLVEAIDRLGDGPGRRVLRFRPGSPNPFEWVVSVFRIADPTEPDNAWKPWRRNPREARRLAMRAGLLAALAAGWTAGRALRRRAGA